MRDSTNREWDEAFVDRAWANMRQRLDDELPATGGGQRRRAGLWLVFLLGLVLGGSLIYLWTERPVIAYFPIPDRAVAYTTPEKEEVNPNGLSAAIVEEQDGATGKETELSILSNTGTDIAVSGLPPKAPKTAGDLALTGQSRRPDPEPLKKEQARNAPTEIAIVEPVDPLSSVELRVTSDNPKNNIFSTIKLAAAFPDVDSLAAVPSLVIPTESIIDDIAGRTAAAPPVVVAAEPRRLQWGAELGGAYLQSPGYFGGLQASYQLGRRWSLQSGLLYGQMASGLDDARRAADFANGAEETNRSPGLDLNNSADQPGVGSAGVNYYDIDIRLRHLSAPLLATYRLNRKWQLAAGAQAHYLLAARRPAQSPPENTAFQPNFSAYERSLTGLAAPDNSLDTELLKNWNVGATLGATFEPAERWAFQLRLQYGLFNWLQTDRFLIRPTNVQLSAVYRLGK